MSSYSDLINALEYTLYSPVHPDLIHITNDGKVFRPNPNGGWLILGNFKKACGWYDVSSEYISKIIPGIIVTRDGSTTNIAPRFNGKKVYDINNIYYELTRPRSSSERKHMYNTNSRFPPQNEGCEEIELFLVSNDYNGIVLGSMYPLLWNYDNNWDTYLQGECINYNYSSQSIKYLPTYHLSSKEELPTFMDFTSDKKYLEDSRIDPFDNNLYTKSEFIEYYGDTILWDMVSPEKMLQRRMMEEIIDRNYNQLSNKNMNHIIDKIIETFM
jgi:hypothetical protein